ncbi:MAG: DUF502 domain-containing protein [Halobacterium sp.]
MSSLDSLGDEVRKGLIVGLIVVAPLTVTVVVLSMVYGWLVGFIDPALGIVFGRTGLLEDAIGVLGLVVGLTVLGVALRAGLGDAVLEEFDRLMEKIPVVRTIYSPTREASTALLEHGDQFERVALVEWPRSGMRTVGFVTDETPERVTEHLPESEPQYDVFVPMSPNPMGGFLAVVPESQLTTTDLSIQEGIQLVVTTGLSGDDTVQFD